MAYVPQHGFGKVGNNEARARRRAGYASRIRDRHEGTYRAPVEPVKKTWSCRLFDYNNPDYHYALARKLHRFGKYSNIDISQNALFQDASLLRRFDTKGFFERPTITTTFIKGAILPAADVTPDSDAAAAYEALKANAAGLHTSLDTINNKIATSVETLLSEHEIKLKAFRENGRTPEVVAQSIHRCRSELMKDLKILHDQQHDEINNYLDANKDDIIRAYGLDADNPESFNNFKTKALQRVKKQMTAQKKEIKKKLITAKEAAIGGELRRRIAVAYFLKKQDKYITDQWLAQYKKHLTETDGAVIGDRQSLTQQMHQDMQSGKFTPAIWRTRGSGASPGINVYYNAKDQKFKMSFPDNISSGAVRKHAADLMQMAMTQKPVWNPLEFTATGEGAQNIAREAYIFYMQNKKAFDDAGIKKVDIKVIDRNGRSVAYDPHNDQTRNEGMTQTNAEYIKDVLQKTAPEITDPRTGLTTSTGTGSTPRRSINSDTRATAAIERSATEITEKFRHGIKDLTSGARAVEAEVVPTAAPGSGSP